VSIGRRTLTYVVIALIVGAALALAVAVARGDGDSSKAEGSRSPAAAQASVGILGDTGTEAADPLAADPAKQEPLLDKFASKDPFVPLTVTNTGTGGTGGTGTTSLSATVMVDSSSYSVAKGDKVPSGDPVFTISGITSGDVTFGVISGALKNGDSSITVTLGESVQAQLENGDTYTLKVTKIGDSSSGGTGGHSISVLSVTSQNGTPYATLEIDGKTYADKTVGDEFDTGWGQIKILSINVGAQTVTFMHGDQTLTLHAGQVVVK
jgi:hypothetical protein